MCDICGGSGFWKQVVLHQQTGIKKIVSVPCNCYIAKLVTQENKLFLATGEIYQPLDKLDKKLLLNLEDLSSNQNFILEGTYDAFIWVMKSLIMLYRFDPRSPRILFSRSIDIVHEFHVPQADGFALHLSATSIYDLVIVIFGAMEINKAIAPCMAELINTRLQEKKPTWIYMKEIFSPNSKEYSEELANTIAKSFIRLGVQIDCSLEQNGSTESKRLASTFGR